MNNAANKTEMKRVHTYNLAASEDLFCAEESRPSVCAFEFFGGDKRRYRQYQDCLRGGSDIVS